VTKTTSEPPSNPSRLLKRSGFLRKAALARSSEVHAIEYRPIELSMSTAAATPTRQLHPLVTLDYRVRMVSMVVVGLIPLFHFAGRPPLPALIGMAFTALVWPQIAYVIAKNSRDSRRAEFRNLLLDSFFI